MVQLTSEKLWYRRHDDPPGWEEFDGEVIFYHPASCTTHYFDGVVATVVELFQGQSWRGSQVVSEVAKRLEVDDGDICEQVLQAISILETIGVLGSDDRQA